MKKKPLELPVRRNVKSDLIIPNVSQLHITEIFPVLGSQNNNCRTEPFAIHTS